MREVFGELSVQADVCEDRGLSTTALRAEIARRCSGGFVSGREKTDGRGYGGDDGNGHGFLGFLRHGDGYLGVGFGSGDGYDGCYHGNDDKHGDGPD